MWILVGKSAPIRSNELKFGVKHHRLTGLDECVLCCSLSMFHLISRYSYFLSYVSFVLVIEAGE